MTSSYQLEVSARDQGLRLDKFLSEHITDHSRSYLQNLVTEGHVSKHGSTITDAAYRVKPGDQFSVTIPAAVPTDMTAADIPLTVVYEDEHFLVIDKPAGMTVHPGAGNHNDTMANALIAHCGDSLSGIGGVTRPGIVHRLDKDTSGLILAAKNDQAHHSLSEQISTRSLKRRYLALCWGVPLPPSGTITANIGRSTRNRQKMAVVSRGGRTAVTHYTVKEVFGNQLASLVECRLETGRTHQIRVHMTHHGHPLLGDQSYGTKKASKHALPEEIRHVIDNFGRQALHSAFLGLEHPATGTYMEFTSPLPDDISKLLQCLKGLKVS